MDFFTRKLRVVALAAVIIGVFVYTASAQTIADGRDGKTYRTAVIGGKRWMAANLNYQTPSGSWCYNNDNSNCGKYGRLYDWNTAKTVCPAGFHLPSSQDWDDLWQAAGGVKTPVSQRRIDWYGAGKKLKSRDGWNKKGNGTDDFGFSALPGGNRMSNGQFFLAGEFGLWWVDTESGSDYAYTWSMNNGHGNVGGGTGFKGDGVSVRCVADDKGNNAQTDARTNNAPAAPAASAPAPAAKTAPRPKAAVYIMGNPAGRDALRMAVNTFLIKSGKYQMVAVDAIDIVAKEHQRQMDGSVSDEQIAKMGYDAGAQYVCVVERTELDGYSYVATRMISVESKVAEFADIVKMPPGGDVIEFTQWQIGSMLGLPVGPRPGTAAPAPASNQRSGAQTPPPPSPQPTPPPLPPSLQSHNNAIFGTGADAAPGNTSGRTITIKTVKIGNQKWMAENLNIKTGNSWCYDNDEYNCKKYGRLYDWETAKKACPAGWHLPVKMEWKELVDNTGGRANGKALRSTSGWDGNKNGTNQYLFSALPGGSRRAPYFRFEGAGWSGDWWTATAGNDRDYAYYWRSSQDIFGADYLGEEYGKTSSGLSVRCVADD